MIRKIAAIVSILFCIAIGAGCAGFGEAGYNADNEFSHPTKGHAGFEADEAACTEYLRQNWKPSSYAEKIGRSQVNYEWLEAYDKCMEKKGWNMKRGWTFF